MTNNFEQVKSPSRRYLWKALAPFSGSSSPMYVQVDWRKMRAEDFQDTGPNPALFKHLPGDPEANPLPIPRLWRKAATLAVSAGSLAVAKQENPKHQEAVACQTPFGLRAATLPEGITFGIDEAWPDDRMIAFRLGRGALVATMGLWKPGEQFIEPAGVTSRGTFDIASLNTWTPDIPLI